MKGSFKNRLIDIKLAAYKTLIEVFMFTASHETYT